MPPAVVHRLLASVAVLIVPLVGSGGGGLVSVRDRSTAPLAQAAPPGGYHPPPRVRRSVFDLTISPHVCASWMRGTLLAVCDPKLLQQVTSDHRLTEPGTLHVSIAGRGVRVGGNPALTQVVPADGRGDLLGPANRVTLNGTATAASVLYVRAAAITPKVYAVGDALFTRLGLQRGGRATLDIDVVANRLRYVLHRPDGTAVRPAAVAGMGGAGTAVPPAPLEPSWVDTPRKAAATYVAAINARDGKTLCSLFTRTVQARYSAIPRMPCWAAVSAYIDFTGENAAREFDSVRLVKSGKSRWRTVHGHRYLGVPLKLAVRFVRAPTSATSSVRLRESVDDVLWLERTGRTWRVAKPSLAMMAAAAIGSTGPGSDPLAPPDSSP